MASHPPHSPHATNLKPQETVVVELTAPPPSSALDRRLWDLCHRFAKADPNSTGWSMDSIVTEAIEDTSPTGNSTDVSPWSHTSTLVDTQDVRPERQQKRRKEDQSRARDTTGLNVVYMPSVRAAPDLGSYRRGELTEVQGRALRVSHDPTLVWKCQGYIMNIAITQPVPPYHRHALRTSEVKDNFKMFVDTGSFTNWVLGRGYLEAVNEPTDSAAVNTSTAPHPVFIDPITTSWDTSQGRRPPVAGYPPQPQPYYPPPQPYNPPPQPYYYPPPQPYYPPPQPNRPYQPHPQRPITRFLQTLIPRFLQRRPQSQARTQPRPEAPVRTVVGLRKWKVEDERDATYNMSKPRHEVLIQPPVVPVLSGDRVHLNRDVVYHQVAYMDRTIAHLALTPMAYSIDITNSYGWVPARRMHAEIRIQMRLGVAFAISYWANRSAYDGILGLGLPDLQGGFESQGALGFLAMLKDQVKSAEDAPNFLIMYLALRVPDPNRLVENWLAWNNWPAIYPPQWYRPIRVLPEYWFVNPNSRIFTHWTLALIGMKLVRRIASGRYDDVPFGDFSSMFPAETTPIPYIPVILDTGCSLSYVSPQVLHHIRNFLFPCQENRPGGLSGRGVPFIVHDEQWDPAFCMEYRFRGMWPNETVIVHSDADPFLCTHNPTKPGQRFREGLVCGLDNLLNEGEIRGQPGAWLFGVNFFHTMYVAMCKPHSMSSGDPYVQLAPQRQNELSYFVLPRN
ncbi:hypothetical protein FKP32DRAFT_1620780 [Trametes sanguinea]|nr:hypothetical protein FKP32DRAFT_1620780 [Trametes sanguinea]